MTEEAKQVTKTNSGQESALIGDMSNSTRDVSEHQPKREEFSSYAEFFLVSIGYAVGIGNLIVYPGRVYQNGGGSFILAYWIMVFLIGIPLFSFELMVGQYFKQGAYHVFKSIHRRLWGVGLAQVLMAFFTAIYYNVIIAWSIIYFIYSFYSPLPWKGQTKEFFYDRVLQVSSNIGDTNSMNWEMFGALALSWIMVCLALIKGVASSGKVAYFTATAPFVCIIALLGVGLTLPGYMEGVRAYMDTDLSKLGDFMTWARAANQIFFSLGMSFGVVVTFASYQQKGNANYLRDGTVIPLVNCLTSLVGGFAIYTMLGFIAHTNRENDPNGNEVRVDELELSGFGLAFIAYTEGLAMLPGAAAQVFSVIFFIMIFCLGIDSQLGLVETVITFVKDNVKDTGIKLPSSVITMLTCFVGFLFGLPCVTDAGYYWVTFLWDYSAFVGLFAAAAVSLIGSGWVVGTQFLNEVSVHLREKKVNPVLLFMWRFVDPVIFTVLFGVGIAALIPYPTALGYHGEGTGAFPLWAQVLSVLLNYLPVLVVVFAVCFPPKWLPFLKSAASSNLENIEISSS